MSEKTLLDLSAEVHEFRASIWAEGKEIAVASFFAKPDEAVNLQRIFNFGIYSPSIGVRVNKVGR